MLTLGSGVGVRLHRPVGVSQPAPALLWIHGGGYVVGNAQQDDPLCRRFSRELGRQVQEVAPEALERLRRCPWPGNIRELQSVLKQALLQASGTVLLPAFLPESLDGPGELARARTEEEPGVETIAVRQQLGSDARDLYAETHRQVDRQLLARVLQYTGGNLQQAALLLGIARQTLRLKLRDLGLSVTRAVEAEEDDAA